jgi:chromosome segregation ATPase
MLMSSEVYNRIESAGVYGIRRVDLRKEFGKDVDSYINELIAQGLVCTDKKNGAITYWSKDSYTRYILEKDPKLRLLQEYISKVAVDELRLEEYIKGILPKMINDMRTKILNDINDDIIIVKESINNINNNILSLKNELENRKSVSRSIDLMKDNINDLNTNMSNISTQLNEKIAILDYNIKSIVDNFNTRINKNEAEIENIRREINDVIAYKDRVDSTIMLLEKERSAMDEIVNRLNTLEGSLGDIRVYIEKIEDYASIINDINNNINILRENINDIVKNIDAKISLTKDELDRITATLREEVRLNINHLSSKIDSDSTEMAKIREDSNLFKDRLDSLSASIEEVKSREYTNSNRLSSIEHDIQNLMGSINHIKDNLSTRDKSIELLKNETVSLYNVINSSIDAKISEAKEELDTKIDALKDHLLTVKNELYARISYNEELAKRLDSLTTSLNTLKASINGDHSNELINKITLEQFRMDFDRMLAESSPIGWVELSSIRERMCRKYGISMHDFYTYVAQLLEHFGSRYEFSSGGQEGIVIRGLIHGFVRRI